jgi:hypothetical protein
MMDPTERELYDEFRDRGVMHGNTLLLCQESALDYVRRAFELGAPILGIDSFDTMGDLIRTEDYVDYSASTFRLSAPDIWNEAEDFLRRHSKSGLLFEIVIGEPSTPQHGSCT